MPETGGWRQRSHEEPASFTRLIHMAGAANYIALGKNSVYDECESTMHPSPEASPERTTVTQLLVDWKSGKKEALDLLIPLVYQELRRLADHYLRDERAAATIQPTALVHEAYLRLVSQKVPHWESRAH